MWKPVKDYDGLYEVNELGEIRSLDRFVTDKNGVTHFIRGSIMKQTLAMSRGEGGYMVVNLHKNGMSGVV